MQAQSILPVRIQVVAGVELVFAVNQSITDGLQSEFVSLVLNLLLLSPAHASTSLQRTCPTGKHIS